MSSALARPTPWGLPPSDLAQGVEAARDDLLPLAGKTVLLTGGTGFLGRWLSGSLLTANAALGLGLRLVLLTRHPERVTLEPGPSLTIVKGNVRQAPDLGAVDIVIHGAASSTATKGSIDADPREMADTIIDGTRAMLDLAARNQARLLFLSSGAVYGSWTGPLDEQDMTAPDPTLPISTYGNAKRLAENLCAAATAKGTVETVLARLFAFVGPGIPLDVHLVVGNFLQHALEGTEIDVRGDGRDIRSYLYTADLPEWCWAVLHRGRLAQPYNVGSPQGVTIRELAEATARLTDPPLRIRIRGEASGTPSIYVPLTERAESELGLRPRHLLDEALRKTYQWLQPGLRTEGEGALL